jgi:hypothetical protein
MRSTFELIIKLACTRTFRDDLTFTRDVEPGCGWVEGPTVGEKCLISCLSRY